MQKLDQFDIKRLQRKNLPYLKITDISETWAVEYSVVFPIFGAIEDLLNDNGKLSEENAARLLPYLTMIFADTTLLFDDKYAEDKLAALNDALSRRELDNVDDKAVIDEIQEQIKGRERLAEMKEFVERHKEVTNDEYRE